VNLSVPDVAVVDEVLIVLFHKTRIGREKLLQFWFHTAFVKVREALLTFQTVFNACVCVLRTRNWSCGRKNWTKQ
jgi:hypothetical protein